MLQITEIRINHLKEPKGIEGDFVVGWKIVSNHTNVVQKNYQLQVAKDSGFEEVLYDTGNLESGQSQNVAVDTSQIVLESVQYYYVRVKIQDNYGEDSGWSAARFLTALREGRSWRADFITAEQVKDKNHSPATKLRREFMIEKPIKEAFLISTAQGLYQTFLNGVRIGEDELAPGWTSYRKRLLYQIYDVTEKIIQGVNTWGTLVGAGWYKGDISYHRIHNFYGEYAAFSGELILRYEDGDKEVICTDDTWKGTDSEIVFSDIYDGEIYDARLETEGWNKSGFTEDGWRTVQVVQQKREQLCPQSGSTVQIQQTLAVKEILTTPKSEIVLDFGQNISGWVQFCVSGNPGDTVELVCFETLDSEGNVYTENLRTAKQTIQYICNGKENETYHPHFTFQGFRYVWIKQYPSEVLADYFKAFVLYSDMEETGTFECSDSLLNQLQSNILWGLKGNSVDIPSDCPQRDERLGWTGDVQAFCNTACYLMDMHEFYRKWLCDLAADQQPDGAVTYVVPDVLEPSQPDSFCGASGWGDASVVLPWILYQETGDKTIIHQQYESMKAWIDFVIEHTEDGIYSYGSQFGDWLGLDAEEGSYHGATPAELTSAAYFAYVSGLFAKMMSVVGRDEDAKKYGEVYSEAVRHFQNRYFLKDGQMSIQTQTAHVLSLCFGLAPEQYRKKTIDRLVELLEQRNLHLSTGFLGTPFIMHALSENGCLDKAYELLLKKDFPSWLYQVEQGATTVWEHWDGLKPDGSMWSADMNSFNHYAYGSIGKWLYEVCAGLRRDERKPGYQHFYVEPQPGGNLTYAETTHLCEYGRILTRWERSASQENDMILRVEIPANTTATIILSQVEKIVDCDSLSFKKNGNSFLTDAGSGSFIVRYQIKHDTY